MTLISADAYEVKISVSLKEYELLKDMVEDRAEHDHGMILEHPELLAGFRAGTRELISLWEHGGLDYHDR